jgi:hypothetical protein
VPPPGTGAACLPLLLKLPRRIAPYLYLNLNLLYLFL